MKKLLCSILFAALALPAAALDFEAGPLKGELYGTLTFTSYYQYDSPDYSLKVNRNRKESDNSFNLSFDSDSRIGLKFNFDKFTTVFEVGANYDEYIRYFYILYNISDEHKIGFGKQHTIANYSFGQEAYEGNCLIGYGAVDDFRRPMFYYKYSGLEAAIVYTGDDRGLDKTLEFYYEGNGSFKRNNSVPRFELAYTYSNDNLEAKIYGAYAYYIGSAYRTLLENEDIAIEEKRTFSRSMFLAGLGGTYNICDAFISIGAFYGYNLALGDLLPRESLSPWLKRTEDNNGIDYEFKDIASWGAALGIGYKIAGKFTPQAGVGYTSSDSSGWEHADEALSVYVNCIWEVHEHVNIIPEVSWFDDLKDRDGNKEGNRIYAGVMFRFMF